MLADVIYQITNFIIPIVEQFRVGGYWVALEHANKSLS